MKRSIKISIAAVMLMALLMVSSSTLLGYGSLDYFYNSQIKTEHWQNTTNIPWYLNDGSTKYLSACQASFDNWQNVTYTDVTFDYRGTSSLVWDAEDGVNLVSFKANYLDFRKGVLGFAINYVDNPTGEIYEIDVMMSNVAKWSTDGTPSRNQYEVEAVLTHELGHSQGLAHTVVTDATMYPFISKADVGPATLEHDDLISIALLYGNSSFPGPYAQFQGGVVRGGTGVPVAGPVIHSFPPDVQYYSDNITSVYAYSSGTYTLYVPAGDYYLRLDPLDGDPAAYDPYRINYVLMDIAETNFPAEWYNDGEGNCETNDLATLYSISSGQVRSGFTFVTNENCGGNPPVADFVGSPTSGAAPLTVNFTDQSTNNPTSWNWAFGDGGSSEQQNPSYAYNNPGTYTVSLTAVNADGQGTETKTDYITVTGDMYIHVDAMVVTRQVAGGPNRQGVAHVTIVDQNEAVVSGATVYGFFNAPNTKTKSGTTGSDGVAEITSDKSRTPPADWCFEVTDVVLSGATYDPSANKVTKACESGPVFATGESFPDVSLKVLPETFQLLQNLPNPFNPTTDIGFILPYASNTTLEVFNVNGQKIATLVNGFLPAGSHNVAWNGADCSSGIYFYRLTAGDHSETRKMMLLK